MGRALLLGRRRRRAGMRRIAVGRRRMARRPAWLAASGTHVGQERPFTNDGFQAVDQRLRSGPLHHESAFKVTIPRKGSRPLTVDGVPYRWSVRSRPTCSQGIGQSPLSFAVVSDDAPGDARRDSGRDEARQLVAGAECCRHPENGRTRDSEGTCRRLACEAKWRSVCFAILCGDQVNYRPQPAVRRTTASRALRRCPTCTANTAHLADRHVQHTQNFRPDICLLLHDRRGKPRPRHLARRPLAVSCSADAD